jgi:hypothetical protein
VIGHSLSHLMAPIGEPEAIEPAVEDALRIIHLSMAD